MRFSKEDLEFMSDKEIVGMHNNAVQRLKFYEAVYEEHKEELHKKEEARNWLDDVQTEVIERGLHL